jgi:hypothetical protein
MKGESFGLTREMMEDLFDAGGRLYVWDYNRNRYRKVGVSNGEDAWLRIVKAVGGPGGLKLNDRTGIITHYGGKTIYKIDTPE